MHALHAGMALAALAGQVDPSRGGTLAVLAVAPEPGPSPELVEISSGLRQRISEHHANVLDSRQLRERMTGPSSGATLAELDRAYESARAAHLNGDYEGSVQTLRGIVDDLEQLPDSVEAFNQWTRAMMRLARNELSLGREEAGRASIERLLRAAPDVEVDPTLHPARFAQEIEKVRASLKAAATRSLAISSSADDARVFVSGRDVGIAPVRLALTRGRYKISAVRGMLRVTVFADVEDQDEEIFLDFTIAEALRPALGPGLAAPDDDPVRLIVAAGRHLRLDGVVAVSLTEEAGAAYVTGALYDTRRGMLEREARVRLVDGSVDAGAGDALAEYLVTGESKSTLVEITGDGAISLAPAPTRADTTGRPFGIPRPPAAAPTAKTFYLQIRLGAYVPRRDMSVYENGGVDADITIGKMLTPHIGLESGVGLFTTSSGQFVFRDLDGVMWGANSSGPVFPITGSVRVVVTSGPMSMSLLAGAGAYFFRFETKHDNPPPLPNGSIRSSTNDSDLAPGWHAGGGLDLRVSPRAAIGIDVRYVIMYASLLSVDQSSGYVPADPVAHRVDGLRSWLALTYRF